MEGRFGGIDPFLGGRFGHSTNTNHFVQKSAVNMSQLEHLGQLEHWLFMLLVCEKKVTPTTRRLALQSVHELELCSAPFSGTCC